MWPSTLYPNGNPIILLLFQLLQLAAKDTVRLVISESSLANLLYLSFDIYKIKDAVSKLSDFIGACELVHAGKEATLNALRSGFKDKEDALQYYTALHARVDYFITRNIKDYKHIDPTLPVFTPNTFLKEIGV
ncbi:MAG: PIN domain-containing protein [Bacteroidota bacterium]